MGLAVVLRFYGIGRQGFWFDEANSALLVHLSAGRMLGLIPQSESTPPLYYCVAWVWTRVFGSGEAGLRSLSALAGELVVPVAYAVAAKLMSRRVGVIAAALTACNPLLIWYSQEARSYELLVMLTAVCLLAFVYAREHPAPRRLAFWAIAAALALATHYYALLAIVPQAIWLLVIYRRQRPVQVAVGVVGLCGVALLPLVLSQNATRHSSWIANSSLRLRLAQILPQFLIGPGAPDRTLLKWLAFAAVLAGIALLVRARADERSPALLLAGLAVAGLLLNLGLIAGGIDDLITRNIIALLLPLVLMLSGGLGARRAGLAGVAVTVMLCAIGVTATLGVAADRNLQRPDWRPVARVLGIEPAGGASARAILVQHYRDLLPLSLYLPHLNFLPSGGVPVKELDVISIRSPQQPLCWWGAACNLIPSSMQKTYRVAGFHVLWRRHVLQFTITRLVSQRPVLLGRAAVAAALTTTRLPRDELLVQRG
jgi:uncharacterized membrane protein